MVVGILSNRLHFLTSNLKSAKGKERQQAACSVRPRLIVDCRRGEMVVGEHQQEKSSMLRWRRCLHLIMASKCACHRASISFFSSEDEASSDNHRSVALNVSSLGGEECLVMIRAWFMVYYPEINAMVTVLS